MVEDAKKLDEQAAITVWTSRSANEIMKQFGRGEEPAYGNVSKYLKEHGMTVTDIFPLQGESGKEITFRGKRRNLYQLVVDLLGEENGSWEWGEYK